eukprot:NODE_1147_length_1081_cov_196.437984_g876_i0.p1 GENE.NODE_1147_length_1081_cov_196.437984_g876_i0~~NODE_1147_length_1081_cov_196.437984_g876_i0.p1  ORF type:complete len:299 (-),score=51.93 NODE_1147_length_1081_cov_196.437984_g876_i0:130-1026(-)
MSEEKNDKKFQGVFKQAADRAMKGGITGAAAQAVNVFALMWLRTTMNYQMAKGGSMIGTIKILAKEGGIPRFYRGLIPALIQSPISRFGDTFANAGALSLAQSFDSTKNLPIAVQTAFASLAAGGIRIFLMPVDAWKTNKQVHGEAGLKSVLAKIKAYPGRGPANLWGYSSLWHGGIAQATATTVGHWPWFVTYNYLNTHLGWDDASRGKKLLRNAFIGISASFVSDVSSNGIRVLKTYRQTATEPVSYLQAFNQIRLKSGLFGWEGLFFRGLQTRIVSHGINSMVFTVAWKMLQERA